MSRAIPRRLTQAVLAFALAGITAAARAQDLPHGPRVARATPPRAAAGARAPAETPATWHAHHGLYFERNWGIDVVGVHPVSSGLMLRFDYRVVNPSRAAALSDHANRPYLIDEATRTALAVPAMENVGELRQAVPTVAGRTYYMIFGNPGRLVKRGSRVTLVVGNFRAEGLVVD